MYKYLRILSHLSGMVGCAIAIYLLCNMCPTNCVVFDYLGAIIGIFAILVTLLVAWNIYNAIGVDQRVSKALQQQNGNQREQEKRFEEFRQDIDTKIESIKTTTSVQIAQALERMDSAEKAYIVLFNVTQAQLGVLAEDVDYLQQYAHYQTALNALLKCSRFPSDITYNIKVLLNMMDETLKRRINSNQANDKLYDEDRNEFIQNMEEISKSSREDFSFDDRQRFMENAAKAKNIFDKMYTIK